MAFRYLTLSPNSNIIFGNKQFFKWQREEGGREKEFPFPGSLPKTSAKPGLDGFQSQEAGSRSTSLAWVSGPQALKPSLLPPGSASAGSWIGDWSLDMVPGTPVWVQVP